MQAFEDTVTAVVRSRVSLDLGTSSMNATIQIHTLSLHVFCLKS